MQNTKKISQFKSEIVEHSFTGKELTAYAGLSALMRQMTSRFKLGEALNALFPSVMHNATKFTTSQTMMAVVLASLAGIHRLSRIATFTHDPLVKRLLNLKKGLNKDVIGKRFKDLGQAGAIHLHEYGLGLARNWLKESQLDSLTLDADSTVKTVYGKQKGAAKGYNSQKKGALSYHPLLVFCSEMKLALNSWFRTGSSYTSNGICDFLKETAASFPATISSVFFRADSGFFSGALFVLLEELQWSYLIKVKMKGLKKLLETQVWTLNATDEGMAWCEFEYKAKSWEKARIFKAIRTLKGYKAAQYFGETEWVPEYNYACYCTTLAGTAVQVHEVYKQRATSETWIEQIKTHLLAGATLTDDFHANDILWQLSVLAYNLSLMLRTNTKNVWREEHATFRDWFIKVPALVVRGGRRSIMRVYECYLFKKRWENFVGQLLSPA
ncbi:MAG: IS1380 family transposase [Calditrichaeota bacterium]|nr:IS1380 family transposase [Calditrichota bacterium]